MNRSIILFRWIRCRSEEISNILLGFENTHDVDLRELSRRFERILDAIPSMHVSKVRCLLEHLSATCHPNRLDLSNPSNGNILDRVPGSPGHHRHLVASNFFQNLRDFLGNPFFWSLDRGF